MSASEDGRAAISSLLRPLEEVLSGASGTAEKALRRAIELYQARMPFRVESRSSEADVVGGNGSQQFVEDAGFKSWTENALATLQIVTIEDLRRLTRDELLRGFRGLGTRRPEAMVDEVSEILKNMGFGFLPDKRPSVDE